ncbi:MAG TPA: LCP family protein [Actinomycetota bacterium]|nr:LCP family protein [Actinomycetota bacterium]
MTVTAPKPTAPSPLGQRLRRRLPEPIERRLPPWTKARPWVLVAGGALAVLLATAAMWGVNLVLELGRHPTKHVAGLSDYQDSQFAKGPRNVLVLGSDTRAGLTPEEQAQFGSEETVEGERSDTIILMHFDPRRDKAVVVHFPRDLRVEIPGHGLDKINAAYEYGGPALVVQTLRQYTGLPIHNYIEVDLAGFQDIVDLLDGVRLCVDRPLHDELAGLDIDRKGCHTLDGEEALAFVRARHIEGDQIPDFSRIARQQQFMRAMLNRLVSVGSLLDSDLVSRALRNVTTDDRITGADLIFLGSKLRELAEEDPSGSRSLDFRVVPGTPQTLDDGVSYVVPDPDAEELFQRLDRGRPLGRIGSTLLLTAPSPAVTRVRVLADESDSSADDAEALLRRSGFIVLESSSPQVGAEETAILYRPGARAKAEVVAGYFAPGLPREEASASILGDAEVAVVVGDDWSEVAEA